MMVLLRKLSKLTKFSSNFLGSDLKFCQQRFYSIDGTITKQFPISTFGKLHLHLNCDVDIVGNLENTESKLLDVRLQPTDPSSSPQCHLSSHSETLSLTGENTNHCQIILPIKYGKSTNIPFLWSKSIGFFAV